MQHTDKYNFNLIETSDTFSPEPLNQNTEAIEAQLSAVRGEFAAADAALDGKLAAKADQAAMTAQLAAKADQTALDAALDALTGRVGALEQNQLLWVFDSYVGTGTYKIYKRLEFDFKPLVVIIGDSTGSPGAFTFVNGMGRAAVGLGTSGGLASVLVTWEERAVSWYATAANAAYQLNTKDATYYYFALGIRE